MTSTKQILELAEYTPLHLAASTLSLADGERFWQQYGKYVSVEFPSPKTNDRWQLTSLGWIGYLPLSSQLGLSLQPKVPLRNLFQMIDMAYALDMLHLGQDLFQCDSLAGFYEQLAILLARRIQRQYRAGLYYDYETHRQNLPYVRGQLNLGDTLTASQPGYAHCRYDEQTVDTEENQILVWTLWRILCSGFCSAEAYETIRHVYRLLAANVSLQPFNAVDCERQSYNQLNESYRPLHALCRFFLDQSGPRWQSVSIR